MTPDASLEAFIERIKKQDLKEIPEPPITFLEIMECENKELVSSNLLAFFLDNRKPHQLNDLCLKTLLSLYSSEYDDKSFSVRKIDKEFSTDNGRIDILIETMEELIVIENKIYHTANNDFEDYESSAKDKIKEIHKKEGRKLNLVKILLGLKNENTPFKFISHLDFVNKLEIQLKHNKTHNDYTLLLNQYIDTMNKKNPDSKTSKEIKTMNKKSADFIRKNLKELEKLEIIKENAYSYYENILKDTMLELENSEIEVGWFKNKTYREDNIVGAFSYSKHIELKDGYTYQYILAISVSDIMIELRQIKKRNGKISPNTKEKFGNVLYYNENGRAYILKEKNTGLSEDEIRGLFIETIKKFESKKYKY